MMTYPTPRAVIFDLFGTLVHFRTTLNPYKLLLGGEKASDEFRYAAMCRNWSIPELVAKMGLTASPELINKCEAQVKEELASAMLYPDTLTALERVKAVGAKLVLCSNLAPPYASVLDRLGLREHFDVLHLSFEAEMLKPDVAMFRIPLAELNIEPYDAVMIGDSLVSDVIGAWDAGLPAVHISRTGQPSPGSALSLSHALDKLKIP